MSVADPQLDPQASGLLDYLAAFVTPEKLARMDEVLDQRTSWLTVVLEDIFQPHNASAVLRSCECFGLQELQVIENRFRFDPNRDVAMGAQKWVRIHRYRDPQRDNTVTCLQSLRDRGYRIVATTLSAKAQPLHTLPIDQRLAVCFGTEELGLSQHLFDAADLHVRIPMFGFTQSFNVSVSAALCLYDLRTRLQQSGLPWRLTPQERVRTRHFWLSRSVRNYQRHLNHFNKIRPAQGTA